MVSAFLSVAQVIWGYVCGYGSAGGQCPQPGAQLEAEQGLSDPVAGSNVQLLHRNVPFDFH